MSHAVQEERSNTSSMAAFWAVVIFGGLVIGIINFIQSMGHDEGGHGAHGATTEQVHGGH